MKILLSLFLLITPLIEVWLLLQFYRQTTFWSVFILCTLTCALGTWLMRNENISILTLIETEIQNGRLPTEELLDAFLIWASGLCLVVPGLISDSVGFVLVFPGCRKWCVEKIRSYLKNYVNDSA
ncbi:FxsA family protein [Deltaproteobacteria bacterium TL4]